MHWYKWGGKLTLKLLIYIFLFCLFQGMVGFGLLSDKKWLLWVGFVGLLMMLIFALIYREGENNSEK